MTRAVFSEVEDIFARFAESLAPVPSPVPHAPRRIMSCDDGGRVCKFCASVPGTQAHVVILDGVWTCRTCFSVTERVLDYGAEWRVFQNEDGRATDVSRCSTLTSDLIAPLGCVLRAGSNYAGVGAGGQGQRSRASRSGIGAVMMSKHQSWNALTYRERSLCKVFDLISARTAVFNISPSIVQEAKQMYKQVSLGRIFRGDSRVAVIAACVYMALRSSHVPRSIGEVALIFEVSSRSAMIRGCNLFHDALPRHLECSESSDFVARFCCKLGLPAEVIRQCKQVVARVDDLFLVSDCTPPSVVGAVIHLVNLRLGLGMSRQAIAEACIVSSGTIARCCRRLAVQDELLFGPVAPLHGIPPSDRLALELSVEKGHPSH